MCLECCPPPVQNADPQPQSVPSPVIHPAAKPAGHPEGGVASPGLAAFLPSDIEQLQIRIEAADTHQVRVLHLYEVGSSIVANAPGRWPGIDPLQWVFDLMRERIAWARETLITDDERETDALVDMRRRLLAPQSVREEAWA